MESTKNIYFSLFFLLCISLGGLFYLSSILSLSYEEALRFFNPKDLSGILSAFSAKILGQNDFSARLPFLLLHLCNTYLMFLLAKGFLKRQSDALFCALLFCLLPGVNAMAVLITQSGIVLFFALLLCVWEQRFHSIPYGLLFIMVFLGESFALLFLALIFYGIARKNTLLIFSVLFFFALNMYFYGLNISGRPSGYFLDSNGHLMLIFSPLLFLYFLYTLYRYFNHSQKPLAWYIAICALCFIWLVSLRQKVQTESYAPFLLVLLPLMVNLYFSGLRVRLPQFRARYKIPFVATFIVLVCLCATLFLSKLLFVIMPSANEHFAYKHFIAKELAFALKDSKVSAVRTSERLQLRLKFYGITKGGKTLKEIPTSNAIPIVYYGKTIATYSLY